MTSENIISLLALCATIASSLTVSAVWICGKLEKINARLATTVSQKSCFAARLACLARAKFHAPCDSRKSLSTKH